MKKQSWKSGAKDLFEMWTGADNRKLAVFWSLCLVGVVVMGFYIKSQTASFMGIAESRESIINFEFPVTIKRVHFLPGQAVRKGELLVELDQPDLESKLHLARAQIEKLRAEQSLKREMGRLAAQAVDAREDEGRAFDPLSLDIKNLELELKNLENRERNLYVFADISGVVGSVNFKRGERVAPYSTIMTVSPSAPTQVQGFIHETLHSQVKVGQRMEINSLSDPGKVVEGRVISIGSRIVELPLRMSRTPVAMWGREVVVEIVGAGSADNPFLLGEKVQIHPPSFAMIGFTMAQADAGPDKSKHAPAAAADPEVIFIPDSLKNRSKFEPSGVIYLPDLRKFAVVSDDTDEDETPFIFLMNADGSVDGNPLKIDGVAKIRDMESIFKGAGDDFYVLSSQSKDGGGRSKKGRDLMVQVRRRGNTLTAVKTIRLRPALLEALKASTVPAVQQVRGELDKDLEIEASFLRDGNLIVAFKNPLDEDGRTLLMSLGKVDKIMGSGKVAAADVAVWKILSFKAPGHKKTRVTDMVPLDENRFAISTTSNGRSRAGHVWIYDAKRDADPVMIHEFPSYTPEGLALDPDAGDLLVLFDEGKDDARYAKIKIPGVK